MASYSHEMRIRDLEDEVKSIRTRQSMLAKTTIAAIDKLIDEAAQAKKPAPGLLEARDALQFCIAQNAIYDEHENDNAVYAEAALLGAMILDGNAFGRLKGRIGDQDFALDAHRRIFRHIVKIAGAGDIPDIVLLNESIAASNELDQCGGLAAIGELAANTHGSANIEAYARIVRQKADARRKMEKRVASLVR